MRTSALILCAAVGFLTWLTVDGVAEEKSPPVAVFADLDGTWEGTFAGYNDSGVELYRIQVQQIYKTIDETTQSVHVRDTFPDGKVITGVGKNSAERRSDGTLKLTCVVNKSNGERVEHDGRLIQGVDGHQQLIWFSKKKDRVETFREVVREEDGVKIYRINGMGRYGDSLILMNGVYKQRK